jgi:Ca2+-binding EF-hand superfamily protein
MKLLDSTFSNEFLTALFNEMKEKGTNYVTLDKIIKEFDVYKQESK